MLLRFLQYLNDSAPIEVTPLGISKFVMLEQSENAELLIEVTLLAILMLVMFS